LLAPQCFILALATPTVVALLMSDSPVAMVISALAVTFGVAGSMLE